MLGIRQIKMDGLIKVSDMVREEVRNYVSAYKAHARIRKLKRDFFALKKEVESEIHKDVKDYTYLQNYLYFAHFPIFSFTESVIILCEHRKSAIAKVLLRTLFEVHIDIFYHQAEDSEQRLALSAIDGFQTKIKGIDALLRLIQTHPNLESRDSKNLFSKAWLNNAKDWAEREKRVRINANPSSKGVEPLKLFDKAIKCDDAHVKNIEQGHFVKMYDVIYRQLSPIAHLNIEGLQNFVEAQEGEYVFSDGDKKDEDFISAQAIEICMVFVKDLYDQKILQGEKSKYITRIEDALKQL